MRTAFEFFGGLNRTMNEHTASAAACYEAVKRRVVRGRTPWRRIYSCVEPSSLLYGETKDFQAWDAKFNNIRRYDVAENYCVNDSNNNDKHRVRVNTTRHITLRNEWSDTKTFVSVNFSSPRKILDLESATGGQNYGTVDNASGTCGSKNRTFDMKAARRRRHTVSGIEYTSLFLPISEANDEEKASKNADTTRVVTNRNDCTRRFGSEAREEKVVQKHCNGLVETQDMSGGLESSVLPSCNGNSFESISGSAEANSICSKESGQASDKHQSPENFKFHAEASGSVEIEMEQAESLVVTQELASSVTVENENAEGNDDHMPSATSEEQGIEDEVQTIASAIASLEIKGDTPSPNPADEADDKVDEICDKTCDMCDMKSEYFGSKGFSRRGSEPIMRYSICQRRTKRNYKDSTNRSLGQSSKLNSAGIKGTAAEQEGYKCLYQMAIATMKKSMKSQPKIVDFTALMQAKGIWLSDPRLKQTCLLFAKENDKEETELTEDVFTRVFSPAIQLIRSALLSQMTIPGFELFGSRMLQVFEALNSALVHMERNGIGLDDPTFDPSSNYLDFMRSRRANKDRSISMSVCTVDGQRLSFGDIDNLHSLDICANVLNYCITCRRNGIEIAKSHIGKTPRRTAQDEFSFDRSGKVLNPFTKSGAIVTSALLSQNEPIESSVSELHEIYSKAMGDESICCDNLSYNLKRLYAHEDISLAYYLSARQKLPKIYSMSPGDILELNFRSSSSATTSDVCSVAAATLAAGGTCPLTGESIFKEEVVRHVLKRMSDSSLLHQAVNSNEDDAMSFVYSESGVMFLVVPDVLGLVCFVQSQPRKLVCELAACLIQKLTSTFNFSVYRNLRKRTNLKKKVKK